MGKFCLLVELNQERSALQPAQQACLQNIPISNRIIFHCLLLNWHFNIDFVVFARCFPLMFETFMKCGKLQWKSYFNRNEVRLVMIEHIESNQIVSYLSCFTCQMSGVICHFTASPKLKELETCNCHMYSLYPMCPVSHIRCHMSLIMCQVSHVMCHLFCLLESVWVGWLRLCYQQDLPRQVFRPFLL